MATTSQRKPRLSAVSGRLGRIICGARRERQELRNLIDAVIRGESGVPRRSRQPGVIDREWALLDTRDCSPGEYFIRGWSDAAGDHRPVEYPPRRRIGGALAHFTIEQGCLSVGPCPPGVDESAGLLLLGFESMLALPLPAHAATLFNANWLVVFSGRPGDFDDQELDRILLLVWAVLHEENGDSMLPEESPFQEHAAIRSFLHAETVNDRYVG